MNMVMGSTLVSYFNIKFYWLAASSQFWFGHRCDSWVAIMNQTGAQYELGNLGHIGKVGL